MRAAAPHGTGPAGARIGPDRAGKARPVQGFADAKHLDVLTHDVEGGGLNVLLASLITAAGGVLQQYIVRAAAPHGTGPAGAQHRI